MEFDLILVNLATSYNNHYIYVFYKVHVYILELSIIVNLVKDSSILKGLGRSLKDSICINNKNED